MVLIFGFGRGQAEDLGEVAPLTCANCHNAVFMHHVRSSKSVRLYFVPIVPYGSDEYLLCPVCTHGLELSPARSGSVRTMRSATDSWRRRLLRDDLYRFEVDRFWARLGVAHAPPHPLAPTASPTAPVADRVGTAGTDAGGGSTLAGRLADLAALHRDGVLTDEEFALAKARLLWD